MTSFSPPVVYSSKVSTSGQSNEASSVVVLISIYPHLGVSAEPNQTDSIQVVGSYTQYLRQFSQVEPAPPKLLHGKSLIPTIGQLITSSSFGKPSSRHSFTCERNFDRVKIDSRVNST